MGHGLSIKSASCQRVRCSPICRPLSSCGLPEGFAFYAVYPEAYIEAARSLRLSAPPRVIGIRSIGTTLGAVVAAALGAPSPGDACGRTTIPLPAASRSLQSSSASCSPVKRITSSLTRDRASREAHSARSRTGSKDAGFRWSGSLSAEPLRARRVRSRAKHAGLRWNDAQRTPETSATGCRDCSILGLVGYSRRSQLVGISAGEWRRHIDWRESDWPPAMPAWERRKFLAHAPGGEKLLLKFAGLGSIGERKLGDGARAARGRAHARAARTRARISR